jgi:hypothetical protein
MLQIGLPRDVFFRLFQQIILRISHIFHALIQTHSPPSQLSAKRGFNSQLFSIQFIKFRNILRSNLLLLGLRIFASCG